MFFSSYETHPFRYCQLTLILFVRITVVDIADTVYCSVPALPITFTLILYKF
jgi:hypothetical protein